MLINNGSTWEEIFYSLPSGWCGKEFLERTEVSSLWGLVKSVQWSSRAESVKLHKGSWTREIRDEFMLNQRREFKSLVWQGKSKNW